MAYGLTAYGLTAYGRSAFLVLTPLKEKEKTAHAEILFTSLAQKSASLQGPT